MDHSEFEKPLIDFDASIRYPPGYINEASLINNMTFNFSFIKPYEDDSQLTDFRHLEEEVLRECMSEEKADVTAIKHEKSGKDTSILNPQVELETVHQPPVKSETTKESEPHEPVAIVSQLEEQMIQQHSFESGAVKGEMSNEVQQDASIMLLEITREIVQQPSPRPEEALEEEIASDNPESAKPEDEQTELLDPKPAGPEHVQLTVAETENAEPHDSEPEPEYVVSETYAAEPGHSVKESSVLTNTETKEAQHEHSEPMKAESADCAVATEGEEAQHSEPESVQPEHAEPENVEPETTKIELTRREESFSRESESVHTQAAASFTEKLESKDSASDGGESDAEPEGTPEKDALVQEYDSSPREPCAECLKGQEHLLNAIEQCHAARRELSAQRNKADLLMTQWRFYRDNYRKMGKIRDEVTGHIADLYNEGDLPPAVLELIKMIEKSFLQDWRM